MPCRQAGSCGGVVVVAMPCRQAGGCGGCGGVRAMTCHEDLHAATQVPAQLVGSVAACERRWGRDWCGPDGGPTGALGEGLAGTPARVLPRRLLSSLARLLPGALWFFLAGIPPRVSTFL